MKRRIRWKRHISLLCSLAVGLSGMFGVTNNTVYAMDSSMESTSEELLEPDDSMASASEDVFELNSAAEAVEEILSVIDESTESVRNNSSEMEPLAESDMKELDLAGVDMAGVDMAGMDFAGLDGAGEASFMAFDEGSVYTLQESFTDENGNVMEYSVDEDGNATITGITVSGNDLIIPEDINGYPVIAVANEQSCVVNNPETKIASLIIDCETIDVYAFEGTEIGTLTIGSEVSTFLFMLGKNSTAPVWGQFANTTIDHVIYGAVEVPIGVLEHTYSNQFVCPFGDARIGSVEFTEDVRLIPENLFRNTIMDLEELYINAERIGANAFRSDDISIGHLILGEDVKQFEEDSNSSTSNHYWDQFSYTTIGKVSFLSVNADIEHLFGVGSSVSRYGVFEKAKIGELEIGELVSRLPEAFLAGATYSFEKVELKVETIGSYAFASLTGSIDELIITDDVKVFEESYYSSSTNHYWNQFHLVQIGTVQFMPKDLEMKQSRAKGSSNYSYGPFHEAPIGKVLIDENVEAIPAFLFSSAKVDFGDLELHVKRIGAFAFSGLYTTFDTLTIGEEVECFEDGFYSTTSNHYWNQFKLCTIKHLVYKAVSAKSKTAAASISSSTSLYGIFDSAVIEKFTLDDGVSYIPGYLLKSATVTIGELVIDMERIGPMAFKSDHITIEKLVVGEKVAVFEKHQTNSSASCYWDQFAYAKIGEVEYLAPRAKSENVVVTATSNFGPFEQAEISKLVIGDEVYSIPIYCFANAIMNLEELVLDVHVLEMGAFMGSKNHFGTLVIGEELECFGYGYSGSLNYFKQFFAADIGTLKYNAKNASTAAGAYKPIFENCKIGKLEFGEGVEKIPDFLFADAAMDLEELVVDVPYIGIQSFRSSKTKIDELTIGEHVITFHAEKNGSCRTFNYCDIGTLYFNAKCAQADVLGTSAYGPFSDKCAIKKLSISDEVTKIPYGCFHTAVMDIEELTIENAAIGYEAFYSSGIHIGTLNIGEGVTWEGEIQGQLNCFYNAKIDVLNYGTNLPAVLWTDSSVARGMFAWAEIGQLNILDNVVAIPEYWFFYAMIHQEELVLKCNWGPYAFRGEDIVIGRLVLSGEFEDFYYREKRNSGFYYATIGTLVYDIPEARYKPDDYSTVGAFGLTKIDRFEVTERVRFLDDKIVRGLTCKDCYVYAVNAAYDFGLQDFIPSELPECENLYIHYNSDYKSMFERKALECHWLCEDFIEKSYGEKFFDEESGTYAVEVFQTCSVCGYDNESSEELDATYDLILSIPVNVPLEFDAQSKAFVGEADIYVYGRIGNAFEGVKVMADETDDSYGVLKKEGYSCVAGEFLSVSYENEAGSEDEFAYFTGEDVADNQAAVTDGLPEVLVKSKMKVVVDALAFLEGGAGDYQMEIPMKVVME